MKLSDILLESLGKDIWYHGRSVDSDKFDYKYIDPKGNKQDGPGFYFTKDKQDAERYKKQGVILTCELKLRKTVSRKKKFTTNEAIKLMKAAPDLDMVLTNYDEDPKRAFDIALKNLEGFSADSVSLVQNIWGDFYNGYDIEFLKTMVVLGYDATETLSTGWSVPHIVVFNPKSIKVIDKSS